MSPLTVQKTSTPAVANAYPQFYSSQPMSQGQMYQNVGTSGMAEKSRMSGPPGSSGQYFMQPTDFGYVDRLKSVGAYLQQ
jgi:hypothetical protein